MLRMSNESTLHRILLVGASSTLLLLPASARATAFELGGGVGADFNAGADTLVELEFTDGDTQEIKAGNGLSVFAAGGAVFFDEYQHQLQTSLSLGATRNTASSPARPTS